MMTPAPDHSDLDKLVKRAMEAFNKLPPEKQKELRQKQAESWARGEMGLDRKGEAHSTYVTKDPTEHLRTLEGEQLTLEGLKKGRSTTLRRVADRVRAFVLGRRSS